MSAPKRQRKGYDRHLMPDIFPQKINENPDLNHNMKAYFCALHIIKRFYTILLNGKSDYLEYAKMDVFFGLLPEFFFSKCFRWFLLFKLRYNLSLKRKPSACHLYVQLS